MIRAVIYLVALLGVLAYSELSRERDPRIAIWILFAGSVLTLFAGLYGARFYAVSQLFAAIDFIVLAAFLRLTFGSTFYWTLCLPAFQLNVCMAHLAKLLAPDIASSAYAAGQGGIWAYPQMIVIVMAARWARKHQQQVSPNQ